MRPISIGYNVLLALALFLLNGQLGKLQHGISEPLFEYGKLSFMPTSEQSFAGNFFQKIRKVIQLSRRKTKPSVSLSTRYFLSKKRPKGRKEAGF